MLIHANDPHLRPLGGDGQHEPKQLIVTAASNPRLIEGWIAAGDRTVAIVHADEVTEGLRAAVELVKAAGLPITFTNQAVEQALVVH